MAGSVNGVNGKRLKAIDSPKVARQYAKFYAKGRKTFLKNRKAGVEMPNATVNRVVEGVTYTPSRRAMKGRYKLVSVSTAKLDRAWQKDADYYIPRGGGGAEVKGRRQGVKDFMSTGKAIEAPDVHYDPKTGQAAFHDGRHRASVLRDMGKRRLVVAVDRRQAAAVQRSLG